MAEERPGGPDPDVVLGPATRYGALARALGPVLVHTDDVIDPRRQIAGVGEDHLFWERSAPGCSLIIDNTPSQVVRVCK